MTSSAPPVIAWLIIGSSALVALLRLAWLHGRSRPSERQVTYALTCAVIAALLREGTVQTALADAGLLGIGFTRQLGTTFIVATFAPLIVLAQSWSDRWSEQTSAGYRRMRWTVWAAVGVSMTLMLLLGAHARALGQYIDRTEGWQTVAYFAFFSGWCGVTGLLVSAAGVRELRAGQLRPSHKLTYLLILFVGAWTLEEAVSIFASSVCAATGTGAAFVDFRFQANENNFVYMVGLGSLAASARIGTEIARRLGIDSASRTVRQLAPMWRDLVTTCAEIPRPAHSDPDPDPRRRMHRMVVEIRDALLVLGRFAEPMPANVPADVAEAVQIARASHRKAGGARPGSYLRLQASAPGRDIVDETRTLRRVARHWGRAQTYLRAQLDGAR
ncbi:MAB_1171c family putative transporter [Nocardia sp. CY41]|uniref:MAB_1171c family putative transporter n=1 Tax=Nocardia sp. CY41 TaxID=2608686 RepID=UPI00135870B6|nr:MAB_1171c family putative transporter [Nocardia sp. CY41]